MTRKEKDALQNLVTQIRKHLSHTFISDLWNAVYEAEKLTGVPVKIVVEEPKKKGKK